MLPLSAELCRRGGDLSIRYGLGDLVFESHMQKNGMWLLGGTEYAPALAARRAVVELPNVHYAVPLFDDPMSQVTLGLNICIQGSSPENLKDLWNTLIRSLEAGSNTYIQLTRYRGSLPREIADGQLVSTTTPEFSCAANRLTLQVVLNIPGGAWRSENFITESFGTSAFSVPSVVANGSTMPVVDAIVKVPGPVTSVSVIDGVSQTGVQWDNGSISVPPGDFLYIYPSIMVAEISNDPFFPNPGAGTPASGRLSFVENGPLVLKSRPLGPSLVPHSEVTVTSTGTAGPVQIGARTAVI